MARDQLDTPRLIYGVVWTGEAAAGVESEVAGAAGEDAGALPAAGTFAVLRRDVDRRLVARRAGAVREARGALRTVRSPWVFEAADAAALAPGAPVAFATPLPAGADAEAVGAAPAAAFAVVDATVLLAGAAVCVAAGGVG